MKKRIALLAGIALAVGSSMFIGAGTASAAPLGPPADCVGNRGPIIYTDGLQHYLTVCVEGAPNGLTYVQVDDIPGFAAGHNPLIELAFGVNEIDTFLGSQGLNSFPPPSSGGPTGAGCNPDYYGPGTDNVVDLGPLRLYTDGLNHYFGICGGGGRLQVNELANLGGDPSALITAQPPAGVPVP